MKKKKGFTLIELLAVIVILGLLMAIAIPSVTKYITESRKKTLATTIGNYIGSLTNDVNNMEYTFTGSDTIYAVPIECIALERGGTDPFGEWHQVNLKYWAYVLVQYDDETSSYTYGFTFKDSAGYGLYPTSIEKLDESGSQISTEVYLKKPSNGPYTNIAEKEKWTGFKINDNTRLVVLIAESEGVPGNGEETCTLCQKGKNYEQSEKEKNIVLVSDFTELKKAIESKKSAKLANDITIEGIINVTGNSTIYGDNHTLNYSSSYLSTLLNISSGSILEIYNLNINGNNTWSMRPSKITVPSESPWYEAYATTSGVLLNNYIIKNAGYLTLENSSITNCVFKSSNTTYNGDIGAIYSSGGKVNIRSSSLSNNIGLAINSANTTVNLIGTTNINNNFGTGNKGGIIITGNKEITINDNVSINNNSTIVRSGAVIGLINGANLIMNGGSIDYNKVVSYGSNTAGAMIVIESGSGMTMNGGSISNNVGVLSGAIASRWNSGTYGTSDGIFLNGGTIKDNTTLATGWNNSTIFLRSAATIGPNMIINGIVVANSDGSLINNGKIIGNVILSNANAVVTNNGTIEGNVTKTVSTASFTNNGNVTGTIS